VVLITLEGIDGSGKSTLTAVLRGSLADLDPIFTREPGATWIGEAVRRAIREQLDPVTEALLFCADHAAHLAAVIRPALADGRLVISDRYSDSRFAYQAVTLEGHLPEPMAWLRTLHDGWSVRPDRTFLLVVPVDAAVERLRNLAKDDHFERRHVLEQVQANYVALAEEDPARFVVIDGMKEPGEISAFVADEIRRCASAKKRR
jgi:dTMP kinase